MSRRNKRKDRDETPPALRIPPAEQLLQGELPTIDETRILCTTLGRGQFAIACAQHIVGARVVLHHFDAYLADEARRIVSESYAELTAPGGAGGTAPAAGGIEIVCTPDFPDAEFDLVALPIDPRGEAELARDLLQNAHCRLREGGRLIAATSNNEDQWLHDELRKLFPKVTRCPSKPGVLYLATKTDPLTKLKHYDCEFAFRDRERLIKAVSRPGVFNHRGLDSGARALINTMQVGDNARVLDIGCGSGVVAFAAACRAADVSVTAIDSHARAIDCTRRGAALNELSNIATILNATGETDAAGTFDLVLGNPPYYSDFRIAEVFLQAARNSLRPGGTVLIVTKALEWYLERMPELFDDVQKHPHKLYTVLEGKQKAGPNDLTKASGGR
ncbi:MAG: methyltransferase domain-containing protein [Planctomycetaceae bacterium]|nr:methyltransferase domain-containing protein [Planctomycetaceae bacterium]